MTATACEIINETVNAQHLVVQYKYNKEFASVNCQIVSIVLYKYYSCKEQIIYYNLINTLTLGVETT